jgi:hypothetical protein
MTLPAAFLRDAQQLIPPSAVLTTRVDAWPLAPMPVFIG